MHRAFVALLLPLAASAAADPRVSFLEQEVRNLQRQMLVLTEQVNALRAQPPRLGAPAAPAARPGHEPDAPATSPARWLDAKKWKQLRPGMSELEVVSLLGPPTSMREENGGRSLLYALEIGSSGFLGGSVVVRDKTVAEVHEPTLQ